MKVLIRKENDELFMTLEQLSYHYFGTTDYRTALTVLSPSSQLVLTFRREAQLRHFVLNVEGV